MTTPPPAPQAYLQNASALAHDRDRVLAGDACCRSGCSRTICRWRARSRSAALFALSLDLILGYAGIVSLGHAAFFGFGAYTAGLFAKCGWGEPITGLIAAAAVAGLLGYAIELHHRALPPPGADHDHARPRPAAARGRQQRELAHRRRRRPAGREACGPLLGLFRFDLYGYTAYAYALVVLFLVFLVARRLINSPFGLSLRGIRENAMRMPAIGAEAARTSARSTRSPRRWPASPARCSRRRPRPCRSKRLSFQRSADVLVMLILGGAGRLYGGLVGAVIFMVARDQFSGINPQYWYFWIGVLLVVVVMFLPNGILGGLSKLHRAVAIMSVPRLCPFAI